MATRRIPTYFDDVRETFPHIEREDLGYPLGVVEYPKGWQVDILPACCAAEDHFSHPFCYTGWEEEVAARGGLVLFGPYYDGTTWKVVVAFLPAQRR